MNWVPIWGKFDVAKNGVIEFKGERRQLEPPPEDLMALIPGWEQLAGKPMPTNGAIFSDQVVVNGRISASVTFAAAELGMGCEWVLARDIEKRTFLVAGIAATSGPLFSIREAYFGSINDAPGGGNRPWKLLDASGDPGNLKAGQKYNIDVAVHGSLVTLRVNNVVVAAASVVDLSRYGRHGREIGFLCSGVDDVRISQIDVTSAKPAAFCVMQFSPPYDEVYSAVIKNVCDSFGLDAIRADEIYGPGIIIQDVVNEISRSTVVIADITPPNPNVYFEIGYALANGKPIILLAQKDTKLPFDVGSFRVLFYEDTIAGKSRVEEGLRSHLSAVLGYEPKE